MCCTRYFEHGSVQQGMAVTRLSGTALSMWPASLPAPPQSSRIKQQGKRLRISHSGPQIGGRRSCSPHGASACSACQHCYSACRGRGCSLEHRALCRGVHEGYSYWKVAPSCHQVIWLLYADDPLPTQRKSVQVSVVQVCCNQLDSGPAVQVATVVHTG
jgi:hypothetical protein